MTPEELADRLEHAAMKVGPAIEKAVAHTGEMGVARVRGNASGRPGPNVITGAYRNSWRAETRTLRSGAVCTIGTDLPYGRRLEFGFVGMDSLGRNYNQPPFPHVQPALPYIGQTLVAQMRLAISEVVL
ncbi:HK97 gp10 family phage protein (plasmid) [Streptomyces sp. NEAU-sy36]|uniref:HK97 gp10 family phage protein n=1 Tax=unclassified Streptomyces TaxID=2593676 RepID=UPI0015D60F47|nr:MULTISPECIES: HK97 gp10 family phage protein [unclassified Streptomyces]QLJ06738.1 HK97 gp10 family phage protein [Streptomyces sp. NEAU-sy36]